MNTKQTIIVSLLVLVAAVGGYAIGMITSSDKSPTKQATAESPETDSDGRTILYWQAPMNPEEIYDQPGKSAMGMTLIPVYADEGTEPESGTVRIDPVTAQNMAVRTETVQRMDFSRMIRTVGEVMYDEENIYEVNARISGWIERLHVNFIGEQVEAGTPLMEIYSPDLVATQEELLLAVHNLEIARASGDESIIADAKLLVSSSRLRLRNWEIPQAVIEQVISSDSVQRTVLLRAPATGIVTEKYAMEGAHISAGQKLFQIADLRTVWVHASFYENEVPWIQRGQPVEMELSYVPGTTYRGTVSYVYPYLREKARDVHVRLIFSNPDLQLKPGMYANVSLQGKVIPEAIVIPAEAVIHSGERTIVFVSLGEGKFEPREIQLGEEGGPGNAYLRILTGLSGNEEIVVSAQFMLDSESRLQEVIRKMLGGSSAESPEEETSTDIPMGMEGHDHSAMLEAAAAQAAADSTAKSESQEHKH